MQISNTNHWNKYFRTWSILKVHELIGITHTSNLIFNHSWLQNRIEKTKDSYINQTATRKLEKTIEKNPFLKNKTVLNKR